MYKYITLLTAVLLLSICVQAQKNFTFNPNITGFKYEGFSGNTYVYTAERLPPEDARKLFTGITIIPAPTMTWEQAKQKVEQMIQSPVQQNVTYGDFKKEDITFGAYKATTLTFTMVQNGAVTYGYMAVLFGNKTAVMFFGFDKGNGDLINKYKATLKTVKLK